MFCKNCGAELKSEQAFCLQCGAAVGTEETAAASAVQAEVGAETSAESPAVQAVARIVSNKGEIANKVKAFFAGYMEFPALSLASKAIHILIPVVCILLLLTVFCKGSGNSAAKTAEKVAIYQIQQQTFAKDETVYDVEVVAKDGKGRFIVTATTKPGAFETWWAVWVELSSDGEHYKAAANYHGNGTTVDEWVEIYQTDSKYSWGQRLK